MVDSLLRYNANDLEKVLDNDKIFLAAVMHDEPVKAYDTFHKMQAIVMNLDTLEIAALGTTTYIESTDQPNRSYTGLFTELSTAARVLTCSGMEVFYIPRRKGQTMPPKEIRIFDPSQESPAHHISNIKDFKGFKTDLYQMSTE